MIYSMGSDDHTLSTTAQDLSYRNCECAGRDTTEEVYLFRQRPLIRRATNAYDQAASKGVV